MDSFDCLVLMLGIFMYQILVQFANEYLCIKLLRKELVNNRLDFLTVLKYFFQFLHFFFGQDFSSDLQSFGQLENEAVQL